MLDLSNILLLFGIGIASAFLNVMAGGGSALALPALILMGLDSSVANGTNRVAILVQNIAAVSSFRQRDVHAFKQSFRFTLWALPGAIAGSIIGVTINDAWFQKIIAAVMIGTVFTILLPSAEAASISAGSMKTRERWIYPMMFGVGFYGGFIQISVGFLFMAALYHVLKMNLVYVNMHKVTIVMLYMGPSLLVYALTGNVNWMLGLILGAGSAVGGWWAAHASVKGGEKLIRYVLVVAIVVMALKLFQVF